MSNEYNPPAINEPDAGESAVHETVNNGTAASSQDVFGQHLKQRKKGRVRRFFKGLGILALLTTGAGAAYLKFTPHGRETGTLLGQTFAVWQQVQEDPDLIFRNAQSNHVNILLIGRDVNWKVVKDKNGKPIWRVPDETAPARSDTMIVMALDNERNTIRMVSLPRDAIVRMPRNEFGVRRAKLNAAHAYGGPPMLVQTLQDELGLTIHHYAVIQFSGFKKLIDQVGGVYVNVEGALKRDSRTGKLYRGNLDYDDDWGFLHIHLKPGPQWLDGEKAHNYVRFRVDLEGDAGRIRRQQHVMRALAKRLTQIPPWKVPGVIKEIRRQFRTDMNDATIGSAAYFAKSIGDPSKIQPLTLFGAYKGKGSLTLNENKNKKLLAYIFGPTFNPDNFLQRSPSTDDDEIGDANDRNPGALMVLREAGILKDDKSGRRSREVSHVSSYAAASPGKSVLEILQSSPEPAPGTTTTGTTSESSRSHDNSEQGTVSESRSSDEDTRLAVADSERESRPRRRTRKRKRTEESSDASSSSRAEEPRRSRRSRESRELSRDEGQTATESTETQSEVRVLDQSESPVPVPEGESSSSSGVSRELSVESDSTN